MRRYWMTTIATIAAAVSFGSSAAAANPFPNIVYIISDDRGWKDVGYHGSANIDTLAQGGRRAARTVLRPADVHSDGRGGDERALSVPILIADRHSVGPPLEIADRRVAAAPGAEGGRLRDCPDRQLAPGSRRPGRASARRPRSPAVGASAERARARQQISEPSRPISSARSAPARGLLHRPAHVDDVLIEPPPLALPPLYPSRVRIWSDW